VTGFVLVYIYMKKILTKAWVTALQVGETVDIGIIKLQNIPAQLNPAQIFQWSSHKLTCRFLITETENKTTKQQSYAFPHNVQKTECGTTMVILRAPSFNESLRKHSILASKFANKRKTAPTYVEPRQCQNLCSCNL
jgi:hypothetical protein